MLHGAPLFRVVNVGYLVLVSSHVMLFDFSEFKTNEKILISQGIHPPVYRRAYAFASSCASTAAG